MNKLLLAAVAVGALLTINSAQARLQVSITANGATFSCFDGEASCDQNSTTNNLLTIDTSVGGAFVEITLAQAVFGNPNTLQLSSSNIVNTTGAPIAISLVASDTSFISPIRNIRESASLTFNNAAGSNPSSLSFFADTANTQGANPTNTPGTLLDTVTGTPTANPDSFSGSLLSPFNANAPFSMTESSSLSLIAGGSITGFNQSMQSVVVPEPRTWAMLAIGFGLMSFVAFRQKRQPRLML
jgi:hypothetical protein